MIDFFKIAGIVAGLVYALIVGMVLVEMAADVAEERRDQRRQIEEQRVAWLLEEQFADQAHQWLADQDETA